MDGRKGSFWNICLTLPLIVDPPMASGQQLEQVLDTHDIAFATHVFLETSCGWSKEQLVTISWNTCWTLPLIVDLPWPRVNNWSNN